MICHKKLSADFVNLSQKVLHHQPLHDRQNRRIKSYLVIERAKTLKHRKRKREEIYKDTVMLW